MTPYRGKYPNNIRQVASAGRGKVWVWTNTGETFVLSAHDTNGVLPKPGQDYEPAPGTQLLTLMVGPSGAGKTTYIAANFNPQHVVSSDQIREDLTGDFRDQSANQMVFRALHMVAETRLKHGLPTIVDATNLRRKDRLAVVDLAPAGTLVKYVVIDRPLEEKLATAGWRAEVVIDGVSLIERHHQTFKSQLKDILKGDGLAHVIVEDARSPQTR